MRSGPKGKLPEENIDEWGDTGILHQKSVALQGRPGLAKRKEKEKSAYQKNIDYDTARHAAKTKYAKKDEGRYASTWSDPRTGGSSSVDTCLLYTSPSPRD